MRAAALAGALLLGLLGACGREDDEAAIQRRVVAEILAWLPDPVELLYVTSEEGHPRPDPALAELPGVVVCDLPCGEPDQALARLPPSRRDRSSARVDVDLYFPAGGHAEQLVVRYTLRRGAAGWEVTGEELVYSSLLERP